MSAASAKFWAPVAVAAALCVPPPVAAQELWNGAWLGMTPGEVQRAFPQAAKGERTVDGGDMILRVPALRAGGHDATAFLDFSGDHLHTVELLLSPDPPGGPIDTDEVKTQLSSKYGAPVDCAQGQERCEWHNGAVDITVIATRAPTGDKVEVLYGAFAATPESPRPTSPTPVALVRAFYGDLSIGDGDQASRLVVPAKRDRGPFSAEALTGFYSSLAEPIRLVSAYPHSGGSVFVRYRFTAAGGHSCDGNADVRTAWVGERLLIDSIHAYSGC